MPRFGSDTIRTFSTDASEMKKLAARDFEDLLQCGIPCFDGLFPPEHNDRVMVLLFRLAEWHGFSKLRLHTQATVDHLARLSTTLGSAVRDFRDTTCEAFETFETPSEISKRAKRQAKQASKAASTPTAATATAASGASTTDSTSSQAPARVDPVKSSKKSIKLNLSTYKWHAQGDYPSTIPLFGTTESYSTQPVC